MADVTTYGLLGLGGLGLIIGFWPAIVAAISRQKQKKAVARPAAVETVTAVDASPAPMRPMAPMAYQESQRTLMEARMLFGYPPVSPKVCGICRVELPPFVVKRHDGQWRCAAHKAAS